MKKLSGLDSKNRQKILDRFKEVEEFQKNSEQKFLSAWKSGVKLIGQRFFKVQVGYENPSCIDAADNKWQLIPDLDLIREFMDVGSTGECVFLSVMVSFYNSEIGGELLDGTGWPGLSSLHRLDLEERKIVSELLLNYCGW